MTSAFAFPTSIVYGPGSIGELADRLTSLGVHRPLIVTDAGLVNTPTFRKAMAAMPAGAQVFSEIESNPVEAHVEAAAASFVKLSCDSVIGLGGGSALDVAKVMRLAVRFGNWKAGDVSAGARAGELAPFVAIPTTAGTGSEVGRSSVITIDNRKCVIFSPALLASLVVLDPELTVDLPAKLTAATGADALTHCIESFTSPVFHPMCDGIALEGIRLIAEALPRTVKEPSNLDARGKMLVAASMGGVAFQKDLGAAHSLAHPLSALCGLHHGLANALVLPAVMKFNAARAPGVYVRVGQAMGLPRPDDRTTIEAVELLLRDSGLTMGLQRCGVTEAQLGPLADQAVQDECHRTNPVPVTREDLYDLYRKAM